MGPLRTTRAQRAARCNLYSLCFRDSHFSIALATSQSIFMYLFIYIYLSLSIYLYLSIYIYDYFSILLVLEVWFQFGLFDGPPLRPRRIAMTSSSASGTSSLPAQVQKLMVFLYPIYHNLLKPYLCLSPPSLYPLYSYYPLYHTLIHEATTEYSVADNWKLRGAGCAACSDKEWQS